MMTVSVAVVLSCDTDCIMSSVEHYIDDFLLTQ